MNKIKFLGSLSFNKPYAAILAVFVISLFMRLFMVYGTEVENPMTGDAVEYYFYTANLKIYGVYSKSIDIMSDPEKVNSPKPDAYRPPGYTFFLYPFLEYPPTKEMFDAIMFAQAFVSSLTVVVAFLLFRGFLGLKGAFMASIFTAFSPHLIAANIYVLSESLFTFLMVCFAYSVSRIIVTNNHKWALVAGIMLGMTMLVKPTMKYFIVFLMPLFYLSYSRVNFLKIVIILTAGCSLVYAPWLIRNAVSVDADGQSTKALASVHKGMYPGIMYKDDPATIGYPNRHDPGWIERNTFSSVAKEILRRFQTEPWRHLSWYLVGKPTVFFSWNILAGAGGVYVYPIKKSPYFDSPLFAASQFVMYILHWPLVLAAFLAMVIVWFPSMQKHLSTQELTVGKFCSVLVLYFLVIHMVGLPLPRYSVPLRPIIYGLAVLGTYFAVKMWKTRNTTEVAV